jgi:AraC-like DNA-binding protein
MSKNRINYYKYFPLSEEDTQMGIYIENIGVSEVLKHEKYPLTGHPNTHYFTWEKGRLLSSFQILLISDGQGIFESDKAGIVNLMPGSIILLYPGSWHRYRPLKKTGWKEYWIGFEGEVSGMLAGSGVLSVQNPVVNIRDFEEIRNLFDSAILHSRETNPGFQLIVSGLLFQIFGQILFAVKSRTKQSKSFMQQINLAKELMQGELDDSSDISKIAEKLNMGYALFRKKFKELTGLSPKQYQMQLKLGRAKSLLLGTDLPVKLIAYETGYESIYHFSKVFKEKIGCSPSQYRDLISDTKAIDKEKRPFK